MKQLLYTFIFLCCIFTNAQITVTLTDDNVNYLNNGNYIKDTQGYLDKFTGIWKYSTNNEEFTVKIVKAENVTFDFTNYSIDKLFGGYKYIKDGTIKYDNLNFQYTDYSNTNPQSYANFIGGGLYNNYNSVGMNGFDSVGLRRIYIDIEIIPNTNPVQMKWKMENRENWVINNQGFRQGKGPGLPNNIILIKQ